MKDTGGNRGSRFVKMHGAGNDFVIIDSRGGAAVTTERLARALGDRNRGVGFDQLAEIRDCGDADYAVSYTHLDVYKRQVCRHAARDSEAAFRWTFGQIEPKCATRFLCQYVSYGRLKTRTKIGTIL